MRTSICATVRVHGFHCWPEPLEAVTYLGFRHRHEFVIRVWVPVAHDDRDIEFQQLQRAIHGVLTSVYPAVTEYLPAIEYEFGAQSCESICSVVLAGLQQGDQPIKPSRVECWEDDENGAALELT